MTLTANIPGDVEIDVDALKRKYAEERAKRLRPDATNQYSNLRGAFNAFDHDPRADPSFRRDPIVEDTEVLVIGGGFAGLFASIRLREAGVEEIRIVEKGADFGGTWYWNRYPGCACDIDAYIYLPLLEETGYLPSEKYAKAPEIFRHCQRLAERYDLYRAALFQTLVETVEWDGARQLWIVVTTRGDRIAARFVVSCTGLLSSPKLPGIRGIETFKGKSFHTSRWDYDYTGGSSITPLDQLADKVVGVIGTGATGIQVVPAVAASANHLYVFQRTPSSVDVRNNRPTDPAMFATAGPGWQRKRRDNFTSLTSGGHEAEDMVGDAWTDIMANTAGITGGESVRPDPAALQLAQLQKMEAMRQRIASIVEDPDAAEALKPYYHYFCKRPTFSDEYLQAFNRANTTLVATEGKGVDRITPTGVVVAGKEYELDLLIYATGFDFMTEYANESGITVTGPEDRALDTHWHEGPRTLYGVQTHGFPNFFLIRLTQAAVAVNYSHIADEQAKHIAYIVSRCRAEGVIRVEPTSAAEAMWVNEIVTHSQDRLAFLDSCTPSSYNHEGGERPASAALNQFYAAGPMAYTSLLEAWREDSTMEGLDLVESGHPTLLDH